MLTGEGVNATVGVNVEVGNGVDELIDESTLADADGSINEGDSVTVVGSGVITCALNEQAEVIIIKPAIITRLISFTEPTCSTSALRQLFYIKKCVH